MNENSSTNVSPTSSHHGLTADAIARRAYEIWEKEGRPENRDLHHWLRAEQELVAEQKPAGNAASSARPQNNDSQQGGGVKSSSQPQQSQPQQKKSSGNPFPAETAGGRFVQPTPPPSGSRSRSGGK